MKQQLQQQQNLHNNFTLLEFSRNFDWDIFKGIVFAVTVRQSTDSNQMRASSMNFNLIFKFQKF